MPSLYPSSYDSLTDPVGGQPRNTPGMEEVTLISNLNDAVEKIESYVGTSAETSTATLTGKVKQLDTATTKGDLLYHNGTSITRLPRGADGYLLASDPTDGVKYVAPTSGGTVTEVSVVSANGFTGSVENATTSPDITITTSVTGLLKGNGTGVEEAEEGTDYFAPGGTDVGVTDGGTGVSTLTAFAPIFGGTTSTGPVQQVSVGTTGQVLTSNGAGALPTMQNPSYSYHVRTTELSDSNHTGSSNILSVTIPGGIGNGIKVSGVIEVQSNFFGDYRDDIGIGISYGGVTVSVITSNRNSTEKGYGTFVGIVKAVSTSSQELVATSHVVYPSNPGTKFGVSRNTGSVDSTASQTLNVTVGFEYASASIYVKFHSITIERL